MAFLLAHSLLIGSSFSGNESMHKSLDEFEFRPDPTTEYGLIFPRTSKNQCLYTFSVAVDPILFKCADYEEVHNIVDEFEFRLDWTKELVVLQLLKYLHRLKMGKWCFHRLLHFFLSSDLFKIV